MTADSCVFKFLLCSVDGKHLMRFQSEKPFSNFSGVVWTDPDMT